MVWRQSIDSSCREMYRFLEKNCPDYEIVRWDESNFDVSQNRYCQEAYDAKKWAFASDYARLWVLVNDGGIYMDTDVEVLQPLDRFLELQAFSGFEAEDRLPTGLMASCSRHPFFEKLLHDYEDRSFLKPNGAFDLSTNVEAITKACVDAGLMLNNTEQTVEGFTLFPSEFFCPKDWLTKDIHLTENSYAIHHFDGSWVSGGTKLKHKLMRTLGPKGVKAVKMILRG